MTDIDNGAAPAAAEPNLAPISEAPANPTNPIESSGPEKAPEPVAEVKPSSSVKEAIERADAKLKAQPEVKAEVRPEAKLDAAKAEPKARDETGKFTQKAAPDAQPSQPVEQKQAVASEQPKQPTAFNEAPKRFSDDAKAAWESAPEPVRAEIHRAVKELETGITQYRDVVEPLKPYLQMAQQHNTSLTKALDQYIGLEQALKSQNVNEKLAGIEEVFRHAGISPRDYAAHILGQTPDQVQSQQDATIAELRQEISGLKQQLGGVTQSVQTQREQTALQEVNKFAVDHPRFEELADIIVEEMKHGYSLQDAYDRAERLNPAPVKAPAQAPVIPAQPADAHTKGTKSISGTPSPGSSPSAKQSPSPSIRDALKRAMARAS